MFQGGVNQVLTAELTAVLDGMTLVLNFRALGKKAFAALCATTTKNGSSVLGCHACTESELTLAAAL